MPSSHEESSDPEFCKLPYDILEEIFLHLGTADVNAMSHVSRHLYTVANSRAVWKNLSFRLLCRSRPLPLTAFQLPSDLSTDELKRSVLRANALERNWTSADPHRIAPTKKLQVQIPTGDNISRIWRLTSNYILLATERGSLICWDVDENVGVGKCELGPGWIVFNCRADYTSRRMFCITGRYPETEGNMNLSLLQIQFPAPSGPTSKVSFQTLAVFTVPHSHVLDLFILDPFQRLICVLFLVPEINTIGLYTLFDWNTGLNTVIHTGIAYMHGKVTATSLAQDGAHILIHVESWDAEHRMSYSLAALQGAASLQRPPALAPAPARVHESTFAWRDLHGLPCHTLMLMGSYFFRQWWPTYRGVPVRSSTAIVYKWPLAGVWKLAQHYSSARGPCAPRRFVAAMDDPLLVPHEADAFEQPLLDVDFSHAVWIEGARSDVRKMRLATFPDPEAEGGADELELPVRTLDIPNDVLGSVAHLVIDQSQGSILISTFSGELHIFQYA